MLKKVWFKESGNGYSTSTSSAEKYVKARTLEALVGCTNPDIYDDYLEFCKEVDVLPMSRIGFFMFLKRNYDTHNIIRKIPPICAKSLRGFD